MYQAAPLQSHLLGSSADRRVQVTSAEAAAPSVVGETWNLEKKPPSQPAQPHSSARAQFAFSNKQLTGRKYGAAHKERIMGVGGRSR